MPRRRMFCAKKSFHLLFIGIVVFCVMLSVLPHSAKAQGLPPPATWEEKTLSWITPIPYDPQDYSEAENEGWTEDAFSSLLDGTVSETIGQVLRHITSRLVAFVASYLLSFFLEPPIVGGEGYTEIILMADGDAGDSPVVNEPYVALCTVDPGIEFFVPTEIMVDKKTGWFSWEPVSTYQVLTENEAGEIGATTASHYIVPKQSIVFSEIGTYRISYGYRGDNRVQDVVYEVIPDTLAPTVRSHSFESKREANIYVTFSEDIDDDTLTNSNIAVSGSSSGTHSCSFSFDHSSYKLTINPSSDFSYGEDVTVTIGTGVKDVAGNSLAGPYSLSFAVESAQGPDPTSLIVSADITPKSNVPPFFVVNVNGIVRYNTDLDGDGQNDPIPAGTVEIDTGYNVYTAAVSNGQFNQNVHVVDYDRYVYISASSETPDGSASLVGYDQVWVDIQGFEGGQDYNFDRATTCQDVMNKNDPNAQYYPPIGETIYFRSDYSHVYAWIHLTDLYVPVRVKCEWYGPNGWYDHPDNPTVGGWSKDPQDEGYLYYYDWWFWHSWTLSGTERSDMEGEWNVKIYIDSGNGWKHRETLTFYIRYDLTEHKTCKGVDGAPDFNPQQPTDIFTQSDTYVYTWMNLDCLAEDLDVRWDWYEPNGSLYGDPFLAEPISQYDESPGGFQPPFLWYRIWGYLPISGTDAANKCGEWEVRVSLRDPFGTYDHEYTDYFQIVEAPPVNPSCSVSAVPENPIETQLIMLEVTASDNTYLQRVTLYWNDGSQHQYPLGDDIFSTSYSGTHAIGADVLPGQEVEYWAEAWDTSGNHKESEHRAIVIQPETVSTPNQPGGDAYRMVAQSGTYNTGGASTSLDHPVQYQFDWGDGTQSDWGDANQSYAWSTEDYYIIKARTRCQTHTDLQSDWSGGLIVTVDSTNPVVEITTNDGNDLYTAEAQVVLEGTTFDPEPASEPDSVTISTGDPNEGTLSNWLFTVDLNDGLNELTVTATDRAGNSASDTIIVTQSTPQLMEGDVTLDKCVKASDAMFILQYLVDTRTLDEDQLKCADTTDDGEVSAVDAMHILQWLVDSDGSLGVLYKPLWESPKDDDLLEPDPG